MSLGRFSKAIRHHHVRLGFPLRSDYELYCPRGQPDDPMSVYKWDYPNFSGFELGPLFDKALRLRFGRGMEELQPIWPLGLASHSGQI